MLDDFNKDTHLRGWEEMLARFIGVDTADLLKTLKAAAWDKVRKDDSIKVPDFSNVYASILLSRLEVELIKQLPSNTIECEISIDGTNTSFSVNGVCINAFYQWVDFLSEKTNREQLHNLMAAIKNEYKHDDSGKLSALYYDGKTSIINSHYPTAEDLASMGTDVSHQNISPQLNSAISAALFIKAFIDEQREDSEAETSVKLVGLEVVIHHDGDFWSDGFIKNLDDVDACVITEKIKPFVPQPNTISPYSIRK